MAATQRIKVVEECAVPPAFIWALLEDADNWSAWGPWRESELERAGTPPPSGVGAIRRLRVGRRVVRQETTVFEPQREMRYRLLIGFPVRNYEGRVRLTQVGSKATITWTTSFVGSFPGLGPLARRSLEPKVAETARRLARAAEATSAPVDERPASRDL
jgi:hypothetical protein